VVQTEAQANAAGYTSTQMFAYSPTAGTAPTVGAGANLTASCTGVLAALCSDTTYPTYDPLKHRVVMRTAGARPASGAWDVGAYLFGSQSGKPSPPTGLTAVVH
jgi:hypothetical protein